MNKLVQSLTQATALMFHNFKIVMKTCDWQAEICGAPTWRYIYHTLHSCDKYFINPTAYDEPLFHENGIDWPDHKSNTVYSEEQLYNYYEIVKDKIITYIEGLSDEQLLDVPDGCSSTRFDLILSQFRHMYTHIGIINGATIINTGRYPRVLNESSFKKGDKLDDYFDNDVR